MKAGTGVPQGAVDPKEGCAIRMNMAAAENTADSSTILEDAGTADPSVVLAVADRVASVTASVKGEGASSMPAM
jgi:hypothetical protein